MISWFQDLRYALRQLRKSPGFTIAAVLTLTMAIGANAVVFSVLNGLILRPLNVPQAESLYLIERASDKDTSQSYPDYLDLRDRNHSFDSLAAYGITQVALNTGEGPSLIWGMESSSNYFDALRIQPYLGRFFNLSDAHGPNSAPYIVLSNAYWHSHFHDDRSVVGRAYAGEPGGKRLCASVAAEFSQRIPLRSGPGKAGAAYGSASGHQGGIKRRGWGAHYCPRRIAGSSNRDLCRAGYVFAGCSAWASARLAQQFRF
jgi:hypothetical protein